jgi:hypothetical protein
LTSGTIKVCAYLNGKIEKCSNLIKEGNRPEWDEAYTHIIQILKDEVKKIMDNDLL